MNQTYWLTITQRIITHVSVGTRKIAKIPLVHGSIGLIRTTAEHFEALETHNDHNIAEAIKAALAHTHIEP